MYDFLKIIVRKRVWASLLLVALMGVSWVYVSKVNTLKKKSKFYRSFYFRFKEQPIEHSSLSKTLSLPQQLKTLPFAHSCGMVVDVKKVEVRGVQAPYNASLIENESGGYYLFFRYDVIDGAARAPFYSYIGCAELDAGFKQTEKEFYDIDTQSHYSEDPRIVKIGEKLFLSYNDKIPKMSPHNAHCRGICVGELDLKNHRLKYVNRLDLHLSSIEKNWTPFEYQARSSDPQLYFEYSFFPHKILGVPNPKENVLTNLTTTENAPVQSLVWPPQWGTPRGGTPARLVDDEYLSFFHSSFGDKDGVRWYVIAAYTFESKSPFRVTKVSNYPILFKGIYDSPPLNTANPLLRCLFPAGFVLEKKGDQELIHLSCGENDAAVKIITLDKRQLMRSLKKVKSKPNNEFFKGE